MNLFGEPPGKKWKTFDGNTYKRRNWSNSRGDLEEEAEMLSTGFNQVEDWKIIKEDDKYILYIWS